MKRFFYAGLTSLTTVALFPADASSEDWSFVLTPYVWVPAIDTSLSVGTNPPAEDSGSILDYLDGAFLINGEARRGAWSILGEFNYLDFSDDFGSTAIGSVAEWRIEGVMASLGAAYAFYDHSDVRIEALAGLRGWSVDTTTRVVRQQASVSSTWIDPIIGLRFSAPLSEQVDISGMANVGGFGVGSELQWDAVAAINWSVSDLVTLSGGYRHLYLDFTDSDTTIDLTLSGPFVAVGFKF
jgi:hypothetical protein